MEDKKDVQVEWVENFISLEGEFLFQGRPTIYTRLARCNFRCQGFNNPTNVEITDNVLGFNPTEFKTLKELPLISIGCDSLYAHDKRFAHMWKKGNVDELVDELVDLLPTSNKEWIHPVSGLDYIFSITGGEPTLRQKTIPHLLNHPKLDSLRTILIETNCAVPLRDSFITELNQWCEKYPDRVIIWSNSPKLSASGESWNDAILPHIADDQRKVTNYIQYFKFVCSPNDKDFDEVERAMSEYFPHSKPNNIKVGIMPEACTSSQQTDIQQQLAQMCIDRGYIFCLRLQNVLWQNEVGT